MLGVTLVTQGHGSGHSYSLAPCLAAARARGGVAQGGYYGWFRVFDNKLKRRVNGEYAEQYTHDADSCGIHASGAGFERVDAADQWVPPSF